MRRLCSVLLVFSLAGCRALRDAVSAHPADAAEAAGAVLSADTLSSLAVHVKGMPIETDALTRLANVWVDYSLFADALARDVNLQDTALIAQATWPVISQIKWERFHDRLTANRPHLTPKQVDSAYSAGALRGFQHILLQVPPNSAPDVDAQKKRQIEGILRQVNAAHGTNFAALARKYSDDGTKANGGFLGLAPRGKYVRQFEDAAWQLGPGEVSGVVRSPFGYHIIRRPALAEVRDSFAVGLEDAQNQRLDSIYLAGVENGRKIEVVSRAAARVREAVQHLDDAINNRDVLVTYRGGAFRVSDLAKWLRALDPKIIQSLPQATDDQVGQMLRALTQRNILIEQADSAKVTLTPDDWRDIHAEYDSALSIVETVLELTPAMLHDSASTPAARQAFAQGRVNRWLSAVVNGQSRFYPMPPYFADALRAKADWSINPAGIQRAVDQAAAERNAEGPPAPAGVPGTPMRPAPGPAPTTTAPQRRLQ
ncbi:MAG TPA: peptidylprolyl isomerase [Gemmatimonadales bacterium]